MTVIISGFEIHLNFVMLFVFMVAMIFFTDIAKYLIKKKTKNIPRTIKVILSWAIGGTFFLIFSLFGHPTDWGTVFPFLFAIALVNGGYKYLRGIKKQVIDLTKNIIKKK